MQSQAACSSCLIFTLIAFVHFRVSETLKSLKEDLARLEADIDVMESELKNKEEALQEAQLVGVIQMQRR